jgi:lysophospholipase L1-like esterase
MAAKRRHEHQYGDDHDNDDDHDDDDSKYILSPETTRKHKQGHHHIVTNHHANKNVSCWWPWDALWHVARTMGNFTALLCQRFPGLCSVALLLAIGLGLYALAMAVFFHHPRPNSLQSPSSSSVYDMSLGKIDHWCLRGDNDSCRCEDPLAPTSRGEHASWQVAFKTNRRIVQALEALEQQGGGGGDESTELVDVAFLGASVVEEMDGRWLGRKRINNNDNSNAAADEGSLGAMEQLFQANFNKAQGGSVNGVALGIAGDTAPNVLWRLMHGEMGSSDRLGLFNPKVWWITLGMDDLGRMQCSEDVVVLGILRVVEEVITKKPDAHIVINSLFPMTLLRGDMYPYLHDYQDSLGDRRMGIRHRHRRRVDQRRTDAQQEDAEPTIARRLARRKEETHEKILPLKATRARNNQLPKTEEQEAADADAEEAIREQLAAQLHNKPRRHHVFFQPRNKRANKDLVNTPTYYDRKNNKDATTDRRRHGRRPPALAADEPPLLVVEQQPRKKTIIRKRTKDASQQLPLWTSIVLVNEQLQKFAQRNANRVTFFDATPLFTTSSSSSATTNQQQQRRYAHNNNNNNKPQQSYHLRTDLISPRGHLTPLGYRVWEAAVLDKLQPILAQYNRDHAAAAPEQEPQLFDPTFLRDDDDLVNTDDDNDNDESSSSSWSDIDVMNGIHLNFDAIRNLQDDDFDNNAFFQQRDKMMDDFVQ